MRVQLEGFRAGMYVRVELQQMPCELVQHFDPTFPLVVGCLQPGEENVGYLKVYFTKYFTVLKIYRNLKAQYSLSDLNVSASRLRCPSLPLLVEGEIWIG